MKKLILFIMAVVLTGIFSLPTLAVDLYGNYLTKVGEKTIVGKISFSDDKMRMEVAEYVMIVRKDKKVSWTLMPSQNTYTEQPLSSRSSASMSKKLNGEISRVKIASEAVGSIDCDKYKVTCKVGAKKEVFYQWISPDYPIPVKTATIDGKWSIEFSDMQTTTQSASIFEIPSGFSKISM